MARLPEEAPGRVEATAAAIAGPAFAASLLLVRGSTLLPANVLDATAAACVGMGLAPALHRWKGAAAATFARGVGIVMGILLLTPALVPPFDLAIPAAAAWAAGATLLQANARRARANALIEGAGIAALAVGLALAVRVAGAFPEPGRIRIALLIAGAAAALLLVGRYLLLRTRARSLAPGPAGILLASGLGAAYFAFRGLVAAQVDNLALYEWTLAVAGGGLVLMRLRRQAHDSATPDAWWSLARRHTQDVAPVFDARMGPAVAVVARYLARGDGYQDYLAQLERAHGAPLPASVHASLEAASRAPARGRAAKRQGAQVRAAAHEAALASITSPRGTHHGSDAHRRG